MDNSTKFFFELTPERILDAVEQLGVRSTGRCLALNSMENRVYEVELDIDDVETPRDRFRIAKFYRPGRWTGEQLGEEHRFLGELQQCDIPVVAPLADAHGETLFLLEAEQIFFSIFPKCGGRSPDELTYDQFEQIGRLVARMHNVGALSPAPSRLTLHPDLYLLENLEWLRSSGVVAPAAARAFDDVVKAIHTLSAPLFRDVQNIRLHGDAHLGNLLWGSGGAFWVDFDDMLNGPAVQDLWLLLPGRLAECAYAVELLLEGYEQMRPFDRRTLALVEPLRAMRMVHYAAWVARRWEDPAFKRHFGHFGTEPYWFGLVGDLEEQRQVIEQGIR